MWSDANDEPMFRALSRDEVDELSWNLMLPTEAGETFPKSISISSLNDEYVYI